MLRNICWNCKNWEKCFRYRYGNKKQEYMTKINRDLDSWGQKVIYVEECEKYEFEEPDVLKCLQHLCKQDDKNKRMFDIIHVVENYLEK